MDSQAAPAPPGPPHAPRRRILRAIIRAPDSYGLLFVFLIAYYVLLTIDWNGRLAFLVRVIWLALTTLLAFHTSRVPRRIMLAVTTVAGLTVVAAVVVALQGQSEARGTMVLVGSALILTTPIAIAWRNFQQRTVTAETIMGALSIYILIGLIFATLDYGMQLASNHPFFAQPGPHQPSDFAYFSFI